MEARANTTLSTRDDGDVGTIAKQHQHPEAEAEAEAHVLMVVEDDADPLTDSLDMSAIVAPHSIQPTPIQSSARSISPELSPLAKSTPFPVAVVVTPPAPVAAVEEADIDPLMDEGDTVAVSVTTAAKPAVMAATIGVAVATSTPAATQAVPIAAIVSRTALPAAVEEDCLVAAASPAPKKLSKKALRSKLLALSKVSLRLTEGKMKLEQLVGEEKFFEAETLKNELAKLQQEKTMLVKLTSQSAKFRRPAPKQTKVVPDDDLL
jgi:hypothetical protein